MNKLDDKKLRFYEKSHSYRYGRQKLISVTTFVGQFFEKFDAKIVARKLAKFPHYKAQKKGVRYFLKDWKARADHGTKVHKEIEDWMNGGLGTVDGLEPKTVHATQFITEYLLENPITTGLVEQRIFTTELGLAGTIDWVTFNAEGTFDLIDWKTNENLTTKGYKGKRGTHTATENLEDCLVVKYGLQLSMYAYILEEYYGMKCRNLILVHLTPEGYEGIYVPYEKKIVEEMVK